MESEWFSDQQRDLHVLALRKEKDGYLRRIEGAKVTQDENAVRLLSIRADAVQAEIDRIVADDAPTVHGANAPLWPTKEARTA